MIANWQAKQEEKRVAAIALYEKEVQGAEGEVEVAREESESASKALKHARVVCS